MERDESAQKTILEVIKLAESNLAIIRMMNLRDAVLKAN